MTDTAGTVAPPTQTPHHHAAHAPVSSHAIHEPKQSPLTTPEVDIVTAMTDGTFQVELPEVHDEHSERHEVSLLRKVASLTAVIAPPLGLIAAMILLWGVAFNWVYLILLLVGYLLTAVGITAGYHRLFTHRSFEAVAPVKAILGILGSMAVQGPILGWVATHRMHHQHSDRPDDPHSPHVRANDKLDPGQKRGIWSRLKMFYHAHIGWFFTPDPPQEIMDRYVPDLQRDKLTVFLSNHFGTWVLLSLLIPGAIAWAVTGSWVGGLLGVLWGGAIRIFMVHHITWSINSVCHLWGTRPFKSNDHSRNNLIFGILAMGEGWHNNHHAFPASARHGLQWWQLDISYLVIRGLEMVGLVREVRIPAPERIAAKRR